MLFAKCKRLLVFDKMIAASEKFQLSYIKKIISFLQSDSRQKYFGCQF